MKIAQINRNIASWAKIIILGLVFGFGLQLVSAWTGPGANPPGGNVSGPLTTSSISQTKTGNLILGRDIAVSRNAVFGSHVTVSNTSGLCLSGTCRTTWPAAAVNGVTSIIAGSGVTVNRSTGDVTISASGGSSGVSSIIAGDNISVNRSSGDVTITANVDTDDILTELFSGRTVHSCYADDDITADMRYCSIPGTKHMCFLTNVYGTDEDDDWGSIQCKVTGTPGSANWQITAGAPAGHFDRTHCDVTCI